MTLEDRLVELAAELGTDVGNLEDILSTYAGGSVQDYASRDTTFTTTNTALGSTAAAALIGGLELSVVGTGRPVDIMFNLPFRHSVANTGVGVYLVTSQDGAADSGTLFKRAAIGHSYGAAQAFNRTLSGIWTVETVLNSLYTFKFGVYGAAAGTVTMETLGYAMSTVARNH